MSFLKPYLEGRPTTGNLAASDEDYSLPSPESPYNTTYSESIPSGSCTPTSNASFKRKATTSTSSDLGLADMMEMMKSSHENRMKKQEMDDLDTFFLSMSKTVKTLPKMDQIRIKMDLLKAVSEAQIKQLEVNQNVLRTPISIRSPIVSDQSGNRVNSASGSAQLAQPYTSHSSPAYLVELPNTQVPQIKQLKANQNVLRTPISIKSPIVSDQSGNRKKSASGSAQLAQPYTSHSSPTYLVELLGQFITSSIFSNLVELPNSQEKSEAEVYEDQDIRYYYESNKME